MSDVLFFFQLPEGESNFHFFFDLFGHNMASESFAPNNFRSERSAIRIKTTKRLLLKFLKSLDKFMVTLHRLCMAKVYHEIYLFCLTYVQVCLCCGSRVIGKGDVSIGSLGVRERLTTTVSLGVGECLLDDGHIGLFITSSLFINTYLGVDP